MDSLSQKIVETLHLGEKEKVEMESIHSPEAALVETLPVGEKENVEMGSIHSADAALVETPHLGEKEKEKENEEMGRIHIHSAETAPPVAASLPREGMAPGLEVAMKALNEALASSSKPMPMVMVCSDDHASCDFKCVKCHLVFTTLNAFQRHFEGCNFYHPYSAREKRMRLQQNLRQLRNCGRDFNDIKKFGDHIKLVFNHEPLSLCRAPASAAPEAPAPVVAPRAVSPGPRRGRAQVEPDHLARDIKQEFQDILLAELSKVQTHTNFLLALGIVVICSLSPVVFSNLKKYLRSE